MDDIYLFAGDIDKFLKTFRIKFLFEIIVLFIIGSAIFKLIDIFDTKLRNKILEDKKNSPLARFVPIISRVLKGIVVFFILATFLQSHGYSMSSLIAGFGITGLAVGFAAKETIANIFGTFAILSDHSYQIGDYVSINDMEGIVEDINMRSTKIRGLDNSIIILPNNMVAATIIKNVSLAHKRRIFETFGVTYDTTDEKLKRAIEIIEDTARKDNDIHKDFVVYVETLADSSINIRIHAYAKTNVFAKFVKIRSNFILEVVRRFREENIEFAFPSQTIYMANNN